MRTVKHEQIFLSHYQNLTDARASKNCWGPARCDLCDFQLSPIEVFGLLMGQ
jgi:hypothetical protein